MKRFERGFTLIELLVSLLIFSIIMIGVYYFFDTGRWMYLHSQNRSNLQENGRLTLEGMEREMRLIGFGIPSGTEVGSSLSFNPAIIYGTIDTIGFRGDVDTYNSLPDSQAGGTPGVISTGATQINVQWPSYICPVDNLPILIVDSGRKYQATTCISRTATAINISPGLSGNWTAPGPSVENVELFSPLHVFYRLTPDADGNGVCDHDSDTAPDYSQCILQRAEERSLTPITAPTSNNLWQTYATNVQSLTFTYFRKTNAGPQSLGSNLGALNPAVDIIRILLTVRDRAAVGSSVIEADRVQQYQSANFTTDVLIRKHRY